MAERIRVRLEDRPAPPAWAERLVSFRQRARKAGPHSSVAADYGRELVYRAALLQEQGALAELVTALDQLLGELGDARDSVQAEQAKRHGLTNA